MDALMQVLSLHGLFALIQNNNLEYEAFYPKLYALLEPSVFHVRHRARVFKLMEVRLRHGKWRRHFGAPL